MIDNNSAMVSKKEDQEKEEKAINSSPIPPHSKQLPPVNQQQQQQQQQQQPSSKEQQTNDLSTDDMDNVIFREDFLDPLEEDNHAMVFSPTGGKGKMAPLTSDALDDDHDEQQHKSTQDTKKKSRFSFAGVFSRTKRQSTVTDASSEGKSQHDDSVTPSDVTISACEKEIQQTKSNVDNDEDGWGDFTSPNQDQPEANVTGGTSNHQEELSIGQQQQQQEDDLLDLDCDVMTASTARTSVDNNELLLLDLDTPSFNTFTIQDNSNNIITQQYNQYPVTNIMTSNTIQKSHYGYQSSYPSQPTIPTLMRNNSNSYASDISSPTMNTPTSPFDFDPLGLGKNEYPQSNINQNKMTTTSPQQLTQPWYPWMATNNTSYQYHQEQKPLTVDDLLS
ncbi:uncharacterized protein BX664DRAFT_10688 [Halteromyces radiatus]|uniref:uncharacterized protein n=1 Tax=Halteromyces radiatus TaxID=101107 RepID=UPI00221F6C62|nr:uncharacterized protein BX664DRAFT_10688 [Halteromyces radiatus]KAI8098980.1 hypothetical protein BX664DRAFT_10688 [Halteromyces radiatus]